MLYEEVKTYIENTPPARERANKDRAIVNMLLRRYPELHSIDKTILIDMVKDYNSMDRYWRKALNENPELRGSDYEDKRIYEEIKMAELGYETNYKNDLKQLSMI